MAAKSSGRSKFSSPCKRPILLGAEERLRKEKEDELRIMRLLQVREASKDIARKIRNDVAEEKQRQQKNLEAVKAKELEHWRENVLAQKYHDYRTAIFQVGTAHEAAKKENETRAEQEKLRAQKYQKFREELKARRARLKKQNQKVQIFKPPQKAAPVPSSKTDKTEEVRTQKRKRGVCFKSHTCCKCPKEHEDVNGESESESCSESDSESSESSSSSSSSSSTSSSDPKKAPPVKCPRASQSPVVNLDIEIGSKDSIEIDVEGDIVDIAMKNNHEGKSRSKTQNPKKKREILNTTKMPEKKKSEPKAVDRETKRCEEKTKEKIPRRKLPPSQEESTKLLLSSPKKKYGVDESIARGEKRFTQITDLLRKKVEQKKVEQKRSPKKLPQVAPPPSPKSSTTTANASSDKPNATSGTSSSCEMKVTSSGTQASSTTESTTHSSSSGRVQFYDYNTKFTKDYSPSRPTTIVHIRPCDSSNAAAEEAREDKRLQKVREKELEKLRKKCEERSLRALDREKIRREYIELTERLETLNKQNPSLLPNEASLKSKNLLAKETARKEAKMTSALEELLSRPAIITCPEVARHKNGLLQRSQTECDLNLGSAQEEVVSSDSCCSILLGYVDDQSNQIRREIIKCDSNPLEGQDREDRLKNLLLRVENLRDRLQQELKQGQGMDQADNVQRLMGSISDIRKEQENITRSSNAVSKKARSDAGREKEQLTKVKSGSEGSENNQRSRSPERVEIVIKVNGADKTKVISDNRKVRSATSTKPAPSQGPYPPEKVIKAQVIRHPLEDSKRPERRQGESFNTQNSYDSNSTSYRSLPSVIYPLTANISENSKEGGHQTAPAFTAKRARTQVNPLIAQYIRRLLSMSRSAVRALPVNTPDVSTPSSSVVNVSANVASSSGDLEPSSEEFLRVERFVSENRSFIGELEDTMKRHADATAEYTMRKFDDVWRKRLTDTLKAPTKDRPEVQTDISEKWSDHLTSKKPPKAPHISKASQKPSQSHAPQTKSDTQKSSSARERKAQQGPPKVTLPSDAVSVSKREQLKDSKLSTDKRSQKETSEEATGRVVHPPVAKVSFTSDANDALEGPSSKDARRTKKAISQSYPKIKSSSSKSTDDSSSHAASVSETRSGSQQSKDLSSSSATPKTRSQSSSSKQRQEESSSAPAKRDHSSVSSRAEVSLRKYETALTRLTETSTLSRTNRIAELNQLINRVHEEKRRLLEGTISSISESGPEERSRSRSATTEYSTSATDSKLLDSNLIPTSSPEEMAVSGERLQKHKLAGASRDSGINLSRPVTAQEQHADMMEPVSATSGPHENLSEKQQQEPEQHQQRKARPPPTLHRFSPQLVDDDIAHELSTIIEVDTPRSRVTSQLTPSRSSIPAPEPVLFPTFEQYAQQFNLDLSQLDPDQSLRLRDEYMEFLVMLKETKEGMAHNYREFPSIMSFLGINDLDDKRQEGVIPPFTSEDAILPPNVERIVGSSLVSNVSYQQFPSRKEYMREMLTHSPEHQLIDTESLENITDSRAMSASDSETMNIEEELRRRNILSSTAEQQFFSSTAVRIDERRSLAPVGGNESGIERLMSSSDTISGELERELQSMGIKWPAVMREKRKQTEALSESTTTSSRTYNGQGRQSPSSRVPSQTYEGPGEEYRERFQEMQKPLNLRDFLTKELLKHGSTSTSLNSDDDLRSQFINSVIATISPSHSRSASATGNHPTTTMTTTTTTATATTSAIPTTSGNSNPRDTKDRQKTSTPVPSQTSPTRYSGSSTTTNLFSGDSHLSSVHYPQKRSPPRPQPRRDPK